MPLFLEFRSTLKSVSQIASLMQVEDIPGAAVNKRKGKRGRTSTKQVTLLLLAFVQAARHHNHVICATINHEA